MYQISEDVKKKVYETFERNEQMVEDDVHIIKTWMKTQAHLPEIMGDAHIRNFLNLNKYSIEKTKGKIDMYYTIRSVIPELFELSNPKLDNVKNVFNTSFGVVCAFVSNQQMEEGVGDLTDNLRKGVKDVNTYLDTTKGQIDTLLNVNYGEFEKVLLETINGS
ncbi:hypothetical protein Zmor_022138 [Zophobas morio]|uniref:Uncharacterized protein n=1 Tax=Zophobas morio TaxID=2755281 RepID=A0AA38HVT1_9CUCU|nr:hypothetical protein Zmor_022138 [Zophobas morio]